MPNPLRQIAAFVVGLVIVILGAGLVDQAGMQLYPLPAGMRVGETSMAVVLASRPSAALVFNVLLQLPVIVLAAYAAARIAPSGGRRNALIVACVFLLMTAITGRVARLPLWTLAASAIIIPSCGLLGGRLAAIRLATPHQPALID